MQNNRWTSQGLISRIDCCASRVWHLLPAWGPPLSVHGIRLSKQVSIKNSVKSVKPMQICTSKRCKHYGRHLRTKVIKRCPKTQDTFGCDLTVQELSVGLGLVVVFLSHKPRLSENRMWDGAWRLRGSFIVWSMGLPILRQARLRWGMNVVSISGQWTRGRGESHCYRSLLKSVTLNGRDCADKLEIWQELKSACYDDSSLTCFLWQDRWIRHHCLRRRHAILYCVAYPSQICHTPYCVYVLLYQSHNKDPMSPFHPFLV